MPFLVTVVHPVSSLGGTFGYTRIFNLLFYEAVVLQQKQQILSYYEYKQIYVAYKYNIS